MYLLAVSTDQLLVFLVIAIVFAGLKKWLTGPQVLFILSIAVFAWTLGYFIKTFFYLPRPYLASGQTPLVGNLLDGSFPSNHALFTLSLAFATYLFHKRLGIFTFILAVLVSFGRIFAHVHSLPDVLGAAFLAATIVAVGHKYLYPQLRG
jgi:undecaprenyl-diphosphatase